MAEECAYYQGKCQRDGKPCTANVFIIGLPDCRKCGRLREE